MASPANQDDGTCLTDTDIEQVLDARAESNSSAANSDSGTDAQGGGNTPSSANQVFTNIQNVIGTAYDDVLVGDSKDNTLVGGEGNHIIEPGEGDDVVAGGAGHDKFVLESGFERTTITDFSVDEDTLALTDLGVTSADDLMSLAVDDGAGNTVIIFATGDVLVLQGISKNQLANITIASAPQISNVSAAGTGAAASGDSTDLSADDTANVIDGTSGNDTIAGTSGDDVISSGGGIDTIVGGDGEDTLSLDGAGDGMNADIEQGRATDGLGSNRIDFSEIENLRGTSGNDVLRGDAGNNSLSGGDTFAASGGNDDIDGGSGENTLDYSDAEQAVRVDMDSGAATSSLIPTAVTYPLRRRPPKIRTRPTQRTRDQTAQLVAAPAVKHPMPALAQPVRPIPVRQMTVPKPKAALMAIARRTKPKPVKRRNPLTAIPAGLMTLKAVTPSRKPRAID